MVVTGTGKTAPKWHGQGGGADEEDSDASKDGHILQKKWQAEARMIFMEVMGEQNNSDVKLKEKTIIEVVMQLKDHESMNVRGSPEDASQPDTDS